MHKIRREKCIPFQDTVATTTRMWRKRSASTVSIYPASCCCCRRNYQMWLLQPPLPMLLPLPTAAVAAHCMTFKVGVKGRNYKDLIPSLAADWYAG
jgi:hypothetical protein